MPEAVSVDDTSSLVKYDDINHWTTHVNTPAHFNLYDSSDTFSDVQGAWFSFTFNGTSIEYWGNQGPYHGPCLVTLEDGTSQTVNSHYSVDADPILLFSKYDLAPQTHTIKVTIVDPSYPNVCELDRFAYTPLPTAAASQGTSHNSVNFIAVGAAVGVAFILAVVASLLFWRRRSRRRKHTGHSRGVLDDDVFTAQYVAVPFTLPDSGSQSPITPRPPSSQATGPGTTLSHTPSIMSSTSNAKSIETQLASQSASYNPYMSFPEPSVSGSYQASSSNEKRATTLSVPVDYSSSVHSGEGSSVPYHYHPFQAPSASQGGVVQPSRDVGNQPVPVITPVAGASSPVPFQHQDAGRIPEEVPPAYKESWLGSSGP